MGWNCQTTLTCPHHAGCLSGARESSSGEGTPSPAWTHFGYADSGADSGPLGHSGAASPALPCSPRRAASASFDLYGRASSPLGIPRAAPAPVSRFSLPAVAGMGGSLGASMVHSAGGLSTGPLSPFTAASGGGSFGGAGVDSATRSGLGVGLGLAPGPLASPFGSPPGGAPIDVDAFAAAILATPGDDDEEGGDECVGRLPAGPDFRHDGGGFSSSGTSQLLGAGCGPLTPVPASSSRVRPSPPAGAAAAMAATYPNPNLLLHDQRPDMLRCQSLEAALARSSLAASEAASFKLGSALGSAPGADMLGRSASASSPLVGLPPAFPAVLCTTTLLSASRVEVTCLWALLLCAAVSAVCTGPTGTGSHLQACGKLR